MASVKLEKIVEKMKLENLTPELDISRIKIKQPDINRPALQMAGYFEHFEDTRLQIIGFVEYTYMEGLPQARQKEIFTRLLSYDIPAIIFSPIHCFWRSHWNTRFRFFPRKRQPLPLWQRLSAG